MKLKSFIVLLLFPLLAFGNMAQPWVEGARHSTLYGAENCEVVNEKIYINLINSGDFYFAKYRIQYTIYSNYKQNIPLLFIGLGLGERKFVNVNGKSQLITESMKSSDIKYSENDSLSVDKNDLIYFEANLKKGINKVYIEYDADLEYNRHGFIRTYKLNYSLYPSKFWKSFGTINLEIDLGDDLDITSSNIGNAKFYNNTARWAVNPIDIENIEIDISRKINLISKILLFFQPLGIAGVSLILIILIHMKIITRQLKQKVTKKKSSIILGSLIVSTLFYVIYFLSYDLIDLSLRRLNSNHGYIFLFVFTSPILWLIYWLFISRFARKLGSRYEK